MKFRYENVTAEALIHMAKRDQQAWHKHKQQCKGQVRSALMENKACIKATKMTLYSNSVALALVN